METTALTTEITVLGETTPTETLLEAGDKIARLGEVYKEVKQLWEAKMIERIESFGPIQDGDWLYRVGNPPETKCVNLPGTVQALLETLGGDFDRFCEHLSSGAIKHGAARQTLADADFHRLFTVTREPELQKDEAMPRRLNKVNVAFIRRAPVAALAK